jgi:prepilin-type N-terminal cleavage/methylation domain-containing protein
MTHRGFSLIEMLMYLGLFSMLMTGAVMSAYAIAATERRTQEQARVGFEGAFLIQTLRSALQGASVELPIRELSGEMLRIRTPEGSAVSVQAEGGVLTLADTEGARSLSPYHVHALTVSHAGTAGDPLDPEHVSITFTLSQTKESGSLAQTFEALIYLAAP